MNPRDVMKLPYADRQRILAESVAAASEDEIEILEALEIFDDEDDLAN